MKRSSTTRHLNPSWERNSNNTIEKDLTTRESVGAQEFMPHRYYISREKHQNSRNQTIMNKNLRAFLTKTEEVNVRENGSISHRPVDILQP